jgi:membrane fusion protein (multidrug efflux system)
MADQPQVDNPQTDQAARDGAPTPEAFGQPEHRKARRIPFYKRPVLMTILLIVVIGGTIGGVIWWLHARQFVTTDDASIDTNVEHVAPRVSGRVEKVLVDDNETVQPGQVLARLDSSSYQAQLEQAQAAVSEAEGRLAQAKAQAAVSQAEVGVAQANQQNAQQQLQRYQNASQAAVSKQQLDNAIAAKAVAEAQVQAARKQAMAAQSQIAAAQGALQSAQAAVDQAKLQLSYAAIRAAHAGRVTHKSVAVGDFVQIGQQLMAIVPAEVWVTANFKETELAGMKPGQPATVHIDAYGKDLKGHVDSISSGSAGAFSALPPENATGNYVKVVQRVPVKIVFDEKLNEQQPLGPGMSVEARVKVR